MPGWRDIPQSTSVTAAKAEVVRKSVNQKVYAGSLPAGHQIYTDNKGLLPVSFD